jgi:hypothetical protein
MRIPQRLATLATLAALGSALLIPGSALAQEPPAPDPVSVTPEDTAGVDGGTATLYVPPAPIAPPIEVTLAEETGLPSGSPGVLTIRVVDANGMPAGGAALVLIHFPLAADDSAMATDLALIAQIGEDGYSRMLVVIPATVPSGTPITIRVTAILPPHVAVTELQTKVS